MTLSRLSRNKRLRVPKLVKNEAGPINTMDDLFAMKQACATAENKKFKSDLQPPLTEKTDAELQSVLKIPTDASDLIVITKAKKLGAYVLAVTQKSPAKFRGVFIVRLQNFCLDIVADFLATNFIRMDCTENKIRRENLQIDAIVKLKMLGYVAMLAQNAGCILMRQYKQISLQIGETVNLAMAWKKSDDEKYKEKQNKF